MVKKLYLLLYNAIQSAGWVAVLSSLAYNLAATSDIALATSKTTPIVTFLQSLATLELVQM